METIKPSQLIRVGPSRGGRKRSKKNTKTAYKAEVGGTEQRVYGCAESLMTRSGKRVAITTVPTNQNRQAIEACRTSMLWTPEEEARRDAALGGGEQTVGYAEALKNGDVAEREFRRRLAVELEVDAIDPDIEAFGLSADPDNC